MQHLPRHPRCLPHIAAAVIVLLLTTSQIAIAGGVRTSDSPYCGINSVYAAVRLLGLPANYPTLLEERYVGSTDGSSIRELISAVESFNGKAVALENLSLDDLRIARHPIVVLTKSDLAVRNMNHFMLFVKHIDGGFLVIDAPHLPRVFTANELSQVWGGVGIIIGRHDENLWQAIYLPSLISVTAGAVATVVALIALKMLRSRLPVVKKSLDFLSTSSLYGAVALCLVSVVPAVAYHKFTPDGLLASSTATQAVDEARRPTHIDAVNLEEARRIWQSGAMLIDARSATDFDIEHIGGSINIPADISHLARRRKLSHIWKDTPLIVYCKSSKCGYSTEVANALQRDGFTKVKLFVGGWETWTEAYGVEGGRPTTEAK